MCSVRSSPFTQHAETPLLLSQSQREQQRSVSRVFCVCAWVPCPVRAAVDGQLRAYCKMLLTKTLFSLCNHDNRGSAHPKFLYRSRNHVGISTNWTQGIIRLDVSTATTLVNAEEQGCIMVTRLPREVAKAVLLDL